MFQLYGAHLLLLLYLSFGLFFGLNVQFWFIVWSIRVFASIIGPTEIRRALLYCVCFPCCLYVLYKDTICVVLKQSYSFHVSYCDERCEPQCFEFYLMGLCDFFCMV